MAIAKKCDICGAFYTPYGEGHDKNKTNGFMLLNIDSHQKYYKHDVVDCCPDCMASVLSFVDLLKKGGTIDGI